MTDKTKTHPAAAFEAAGQSHAQALVACAEAAAEMGAHADRMLRTQVGQVSAAQKAAADFLTQSVETSLKAQAAVRKAGVELAQSFAI